MNRRERRKARRRLFGHLRKSGVNLRDEDAVYDELVEFASTDPELAGFEMLVMI